MANDLLFTTHNVFLKNIVVCLTMIFNQTVQLFAMSDVTYSFVVVVYSL